MKISKLSENGFTKNMTDHTPKYDSTQDTYNHIFRVRELLDKVCENLQERALYHDDSKLHEPEKSAYDVITPRLKDLEYGSEEYRASLREMKPAINHHYANNNHHPEFYENGIEGMSLFCLLEMICDWKAASERHTTGDIRNSLKINVERFKIEPQLRSILENTLTELGF